MIPLSTLSTLPMAALPMAALPMAPLPLKAVSGSVAMPLVEIELPWNPPELTQIPPMQLFVGLIVLTALVLVGLYFYKKQTKND